MKLIKKLITIFIIICFLSAAVIYINVLSFSRKASPRESDVIIVLGCQIWDRNPSWSLEYRLRKALELYRKGYAEYIIVSGGQGRDEVTTEANVMKSWLVSHGIDERKIIEEGRSTSTFENLKYSKDIMDGSGMKTAIIVSNDFHMYRSLNLAKRLGIEASGAPAPAVEYLKGYYQLREVASVVKSFIADR